MKKSLKSFIKRHDIDTNSKVELLEKSVKGKTREWRVESKTFRDFKKSRTIRQDSAKSYKETKPNFSREEIFFLSTMALGGRV